MKKFKLTDKTLKFDGRTLHRIEALRDFSDVKAGDEGGFVEKEENLSHEGDAWIYDSAIACDNAIIADYAVIKDFVEVKGDAMVYAEAKLSGGAHVGGDAMIAR